MFINKIIKVHPGMGKQATNKTTNWQQAKQETGTVQKHKIRVSSRGCDYSV